MYIAVGSCHHFASNMFWPNLAVIKHFSIVQGGVPKVNMYDWEYCIHYHRIKVERMKHMVKKTM